MNAGTSIALLIPNRKDDWIVRTDKVVFPPCSGPSAGSSAGRTDTIPAQTGILPSIS